MLRWLAQPCKPDGFLRFCSCSADSRYFVPCNVGQKGPPEVRLKLPQLSCRCTPCERRRELMGGNERRSAVAFATDFEVACPLV